MYNRKQKREIFYKAKKHLLAQKVKGSIAPNDQFINGISCAYAGDNNTACAIGCLIDDKELCKRADTRANTSIKRLLSDAYSSDSSDLYKEMRAALKTDGCEQDVTFLFHLQNLHDYNEPSQWKQKLSEFKKEFKL